jgi:hypothetical protein
MNDAKNACFCRGMGFLKDAELRHIFAWTGGRSLSDIWAFRNEY